MEETGHFSRMVDVQIIRWNVFNPDLFGCAVPSTLCSNFVHSSQESILSWDKKALKNNPASLTAGQDRRGGQEANILSCHFLEWNWVAAENMADCAFQRRYVAALWPGQVLVVYKVESVQQVVCMCAVCMSVHGLTGLWCPQETAVSQPVCSGPRC